VVPPFHYIEKGDKNDAAIFCSVSVTLFFCFVKQETKFRGKNFTKFCGKNFTKFHKTKFCKILRNKHKNFEKYEMNYLAKFRKISFRQISSTTLPGMLTSR
jgi:hypothetical protein